MIFHWGTEEEFTQGGFTRDVARDGAFIMSSVCPPVGSAVRIEILIPSPSHHGEELRIECAGTVVRKVDELGLKGFGFSGVFDDKHLRGRVPTAERD